MYKILKPLLLLLFVIPITVLAQKSLLRDADMLYKQRAYFYAIEKYESFLGKKKVYRKFDEKNIIDVKRKLANSYRLIKKTKEAEKVYLDLVANHKDSEAEIVFYLAAMLQANGKYALAKQRYKEYKTIAPDERISDKFMADLDELIRAASNKYPTYNTKAMEFNSPKSDYGTAYLNGKLIFASTRRNTKIVHSRWSGEAFSELFTYDGKTAERLPKEVNSTLNEGAACFSPNGERMYFTRNFFIKGKEYNSKNNNYLAILESKLVDGKWTEGTKLNFDKKNYNFAHPSLTPDGETMFFASDMAKGNGEMDIYKVTRKGSSWTKPENIGEAINTKGNDIFPFAQSSDTLFFASDGHAGYGGLDVFMAVLANGKWNVTNMKMPINSPQDDFGFMWIPSNEGLKTGYVTSNRNKSDDIYQVRKNIFVVGTIRDDQTQELITGALTEFKPQTNNIGASSEEGSNFKFHLNTNYNYVLSVSKRGYLPKDITLTENMYYSKVINDTIHLDIKLHNIMLKCIAYDDSTKMPLGNVSIKISGGMDSLFTTKADGRFEMLTNPVRDYTLTFDKEFYLSKNEYIPSSMLKNWNYSDTLKVYMKVDRSHDIFVYFNIVDQTSSKPISKAEITQYQHYISTNLDTSTTPINGVVNFRCSKAYTYEFVVNHPYFTTKTHHLDFENHDINDEDTIIVNIPQPVFKGAVVDVWSKTTIASTRMELFESDLFGEIKITKTDGSYHFYLFPEKKYSYNKSYPLKVMHPDYYNRDFELSVERIEQNIVTDKKYSYKAYIISADTLTNRENGKTVEVKAGEWNYKYENFNLPLAAPEKITNKISSLNEVYANFDKLLGDYENAEPEISYVFGNIYFDVDKDKIKPETKIVFDSLNNLLSAKQNLKLRIIAFADSTGRAMHNLDLSKRRAMSARKKLIDIGIDQERINLYYYGEEPINNECPKDDTKCIDSRLQFSRRVEFKIVKTTNSQ